MTNLFKPKMPDTSAQTKAMEKQEEQIDRQEFDERKKIAARMRARRTGGMRSLLSRERQTPQIGLSGISYE